MPSEIEVSKTCQLLWERIPASYKGCQSFSDLWEAYQLSFHQILISASEKAKGKPITWNVGITDLDNPMLDLCARLCLSQNQTPCTKLLLACSFHLLVSHYLLLLITRDASSKEYLFFFLNSVIPNFISKLSIDK